MRRLATLTLLAVGTAVLALPAQAQGFRGPGSAWHQGGYGGPRNVGYGYGRGYRRGPGLGVGVAAGAAVAGFAIGTATGALAGGYGPGYDYTDSYVQAPPSNERYGYAWAPAAEAAAFSYPVGPDNYSVESGWYGY